MGRALVVIDGENILQRCEAMLKEGWELMPQTTHSKGRYVWSQQIIRTIVASDTVLRVWYYTTHVGGEDLREELVREMAELTYGYGVVDQVAGRGTVVPKVFKKLSQSQKSASVDINIAVDVLRHAYNKSVDVVLLLSGDGDFIPVIREAMRAGVKVIVGALSSGLAKEIVGVCDDFVDLDAILLHRKRDD